MGLERCEKEGQFSMLEKSRLAEIRLGMNVHIRVCADAIEP